MKLLGAPPPTDRTHTPRARNTLRKSLLVGMVSLAATIGLIVTLVNPQTTRQLTSPKSLGGAMHGGSPGARGERLEALLSRSSTLHLVGISVASLILAGSIGGTLLAYRRLERESQESRERVAEISKDRMRFIRGITHDLKNPLGSTLMLLQLLQQGSKGELSDQQNEVVRLAEQGVRNTLDLIDALFMLTNPDAGQPYLHIAPHNIEHLVREVRSLHAPAASAAGHKISIEIDPELGLVLLDKRRTRRILDNLISNAIKFTPQGGKVEISVRGQGDVLTLAVRDSGCGIKTTETEAVFEEFYRRPDHSWIQGTGVGLAISRKLAREMGGDLRVESTLGIGSTFILTLPWRLASSQHPHPPTTQDRPQGMGQ